MAIASSLVLGNKKIYAQPLSDEQANVILNKKPGERSVDESIELHNFLRQKGKAEAERATGKHVVVFFGPTGAGKSTWVNALYGCQLIPNDSGALVVSKESPKEAVVPIGTTPVSCTWNIKAIPNMIRLPEEANRWETEYLTVFDTPGLDDNRGIEVAMANAITFRQILMNATSVRFVLTFEEGFQSRSRLWKELVTLVQSRFGTLFGREENSLCLLITQYKNPLPYSKEKIRECHKNDPNMIDLSGCAVCYDPCKPEDRRKLIDTIIGTKAYTALQHTHIALSPAEYFDALKIGQKIGQSISTDLRRGDTDGIKTAVVKIQFTHGFSELGGEDLKLCHEAVVKVVLEYARQIAKQIAPSPGCSLHAQIKGLNRYLFIRGKFRKYVSFEELDSDVRAYRRSTHHPYWGIDLTKPQPAILSTASTAGCAAAAFFFPPALVGVFCSGTAALFLAIKYLAPSELEKDISMFFDV